MHPHATFLTRTLAAVRRGLGLAEPQFAYPLVGITLLGVLWAVTLSLIQVERATALKAASSSTLELADTYEAQAVRALREIDQTLRLVKFVFERNGGRIDLAELRAKELLPPDLLFVVNVVDAEGRVVARSRAMPPVDFAAEDFLRQLRDRDVVSVSQPQAGSNPLEAKLHLGRRLETAGGVFAGAAIVSVPAAFFVSGYETGKLGEKGVLALVGTDGVMRARRTGEVTVLGERMDYSAAIAAGPGLQALLAPSAWDKVRRFTIAREIFDFPLAMVVGLAEEEQLQAVNDRAATYLWRAGAGSVLVLLVLGALGGLSWKLTGTRQNATRELEEEISVRRNAQEALNLRNMAIESSVNAIVITKAVGPDYPIEYVNPAFERITGYPPAEAVGRNPSFLLGSELEQPAVGEIERAVRERRDGHAVLRNYRKDGALFWNDFYMAPVRNSDGTVTHFVGVMNDVTEAKQYEDQLAHQANFDSLTGLANRNLLQDRLQQAIVGARRTSRTVATVFIDLDHFKLVNDTLGHRVGDELLCEIAARLKGCVRESDTVARLGGDEFILVLDGHTDSGDVSLESNLSAVMRKLLSQVSLPFKLGDSTLRPTCSIGVSVYPQDGENADMLLRNADAAMYRAKELGRNRFQLFTADVHERIRRRMELENNLRLALERGEFELAYQPQVHLKSGSVIGIEALLRWRHPEKGLIGPGSFISFAEETGLIVPIGEWVLREACRQNKAWHDAGLPRVPVAVNMSAKQCEQENIEEVIRDALHGAGLEARYLELEITESISMANPEQSVPLMQRLRATGVSLSIDDFGTGFSNLSYLPRFPVDRLKIDLSFVRQMVSDPGSLAVSEAIINMSHALKLQVVAEGVENAMQLEMLGARRCDSIQGYLFSPPLPADALGRLLAEDRRLMYVPGTHVAPAPTLVM